MIQKIKEYALGLYSIAAALTWISILDKNEIEKILEAEE